MVQKKKEHYNLQAIQKRHYKLFKKIRGSHRSVDLRSKYFRLQSTPEPEEKYSFSLRSVIILRHMRSVLTIKRKKKLAHFEDKIFRYRAVQFQFLLMVQKCQYLFVIFTSILVSDW